MPRPRLSRIVIVLGLLIAIAAAVAAVLVPRWIKARIIAAAAAHGVALTIDDLSIAPGRTRLRGVRATPLIQTDAKNAPKITASAATVDVELAGLTPTAIAVTGMIIDLDGSAADVRAALAARDQSRGGGTSSITRVTLSDSTFTWKHALETNVVAISAAHVSGNVTRKPGRALGDDWHVETPELRAFDAPVDGSARGGTSRTPDDKLAPWALVADDDAEGTRGTMTLPLHASASIVRPAAGGMSLDIDTPNVHTTDLGIPAALLGMYGDETSRFELHLHHLQKADGGATGTIVATASDVFIGASTARTSVTLDGRYAGDASKLDLTGATLRAGPFTGTLEGWLAFPAPSAGAYRASLRYTSGIVSCLDAVKAQVTSYGDVGKGVAALAGMLGLDRVVEGRVMLKGEVDIGETANRFAFHTEGDCKLSYLPF